MPAARFFVFLTSVSKSVKSHIPHSRKTHPIGRAQISAGAQFPSISVDKVLSLFLFVEFEFTCDMGLENDPKILGSSVNRNRIRRAAEKILISVPQNKVKQKNPGYRLKTGFSMETRIPLGQLH